MMASVVFCVHCPGWGYWVLADQPRRISTGANENMGKFFSFEPRFGWPEMISAIAIVISIWALIMSSRSVRPSMVYSQMPSVVSPKCDEQLRQLTMRGYVLFRFTNLGGTATTLTGFGPWQDSEAIVSISADGDTLQTAARLYLPSDPVSFNESWEYRSDSIFSESSLLRIGSDMLGRSHPQILDIKFDPGETKVVVIGISAAWNDMNNLGLAQIGYADISLEAIFSHGVSIPVHVRVEKPRGVRGIDCRFFSETGRAKPELHT